LVSMGHFPIRLSLNLNKFLMSSGYIGELVIFSL